MGNEITNHHICSMLVDDILQPNVRPTKLDNVFSRFLKNGVVVLHKHGCHL